MKSVKEKKGFGIVNNLILQEISFERYQDWFEQNYSSLNNRSPFHHPAWFDCVSRGIKFEIFVIGIFKGQDLVAALPGFLTRRGPMRLVGSPLPGAMTSYLGPVGMLDFQNKEKLEELISEFDLFVRKQLSASFFRITMRDASQHYPMDLTSNWEQERPRSYRLDLTPGEDELWMGVKSDCRRNIKRAKREQIEIVPLLDAGMFYYFLEQTLMRHGTTSWHKERFFQLLLSELVPRELLWAWGAKFKGETIAAGLFFHDEHEMHFLSGASLPKYGNLPTSYLLHWHAIVTATQAGLKIYNSEASRIPSIDRFKESFRPNLERRHTLIWAPNYARIAKKVYVYSSSTLRSLRSKLEKGRKVNASSTKLG